MRSRENKERGTFVCESLRVCVCGCVYVHTHTHRYQERKRHQLQQYIGEPQDRTPPSPRGAPSVFAR